MNRLFRASYRTKARRSRSQRGSSEIAEFIPALYILFLIVFLPLINLGTLFVAAAVQYLATNDFVSKASTQPDYPTALNTMASESFLFQSTGLSNFISMAPRGGYVGCGDDLYVVTTNIASGTVTTSSPDQPLTQPVNTQNNIYELSVTSTYNVSPLVNLSQVPLLGDVPGLGKPVTLSFVANRPVEHPGGLVATAAGGGGNVGNVSPFNRVTLAGPTSAVATNITWRDPNIFQQIQAAGQTVVTVNVITVMANYGNVQGAITGGWIPSGIIVSPGQKVWIDTQAAGSWGCMGNSTDANGTPGGTNEEESIDLDLPNMMLIGYVGSAPILPVGHTSGAISGDPRFIPSGDTMLNYPINYTGPLSFACNDNQNYPGQPDYGSQEVRIIITQ